MRLPRWMFVLGGLALLGGCGGGGGSPEEEEVENPTFTRDVVPVFQASCGFGSGCHGTANPAGYVPLTTNVADASTLLARLKQESKREPSLPLVKPGDPAGSFLLRKVTGDYSGLPCGPHACGERMPQRSAPLPQKETALLERWIQQGAPLE